ncbi:MAG: hypothetical protein IJI54_10115 [Kiritimatiellae bacterium]|nr:hypothetical protein [Kiritimatiellia bacterium]
MTTAPAINIKHLGVLSAILDMGGEGCSVAIGNLTATNGKGELSLTEVQGKVKTYFHLTGSDNIQRYMVECLSWIAAKSEQNSTAISFEEWSAESRQIVSRICTKRLIDYFSKCSIDERAKEMAAVSSQDPLFIRHIELLGAEGLPLLNRALEAYCSAEMNRQRWYEYELYGEDDLVEYENRLLNKHDEIFNRARNPGQSDEARGAETLRMCSSEGDAIPLADKPTQGRMAEGTYHRIANSGNTIGWHPQWPHKLKRD